MWPLDTLRIGLVWLYLNGPERADRSMSAVEPRYGPLTRCGPCRPQRVSSRDTVRQRATLWIELVCLQVSGPERADRSV